MIKVLARSDSYCVDFSSSLYLTKDCLQADILVLCDGSEWEIVQTCAQKFTYADVKQLMIKFKNEFNRVSNQMDADKMDADKMDAAVLRWNYETVSMELERYESELLV